VPKVGSVIGVKS